MNKKTNKFKVSLELLVSLKFTLNNVRATEKIQDIGLLSIVLKFNIYQIIEVEEFGFDL